MIQLIGRLRGISEKYLWHINDVLYVISNGCVVIGTDCSAIGHNVSTTNRIILLCFIGKTVNGLSQPFAGVLYIIDSLSEFN